MCLPFSIFRKKLALSAKLLWPKFQPSRRKFSFQRLFVFQGLKIRPHTLGLLLESRVAQKQSWVPSPRVNDHVDLSLQWRHQKWGGGKPRGHGENLQGVTGIFFWGAAINFSWFFPGVKLNAFSTCSRKFPFWLTQYKFHISVVFKSEKKKKKILSSFCNFSSIHFHFSTFPFSIFLLFFLLHFPFFLCLSFASWHERLDRQWVPLKYL